MRGINFEKQLSYALKSLDSLQRTVDFLESLDTDTDTEISFWTAERDHAQARVDRLKAFINGETPQAEVKAETVAEAAPVATEVKAEPEPVKKKKKKKKTKAAPQKKKKKKSKARK